MTPRKDVANNIEQAVQDLMVYLLTFRDKEEKIKLQTQLSQVLELAKKEYAGEAMSYFNQYIVYPFSRTRSGDVTKAIEDFNECLEDPFAQFVILVDLLTNGACKSTSLNTIIIDKLIEATGKYNPIPENEEELQKTERDNETTRMRLRKLFITQATLHIEQKKADKIKEEQKRQADLAKSAAPSLLLTREDYTKIIAELNRFLKQEPKEQPKQLAPAKITEGKLAKNKQRLESFFANKQSSQQREADVASTQVISRTEAAPAKLIPGKISDHAELLANRNNIANFFANKLAANKPAPVKETFADEFAAITRYFGAR